VAHERSHRSAVGSFPATLRTRERAGSGLAAGGDGAAIRLQPGGFGAAVRSQCELGVAAAGASRASAGNNSTAGARGQNRRAGGDEVSGAGGAEEFGRLPANGGDLRRASLRYARSGATLCRLAPGDGGDPSAHSRGSGPVFQSATAGGHTSQACRRSDPRPGDGGGDLRARPSATGRRGSLGSRRAAARRHAAADRADGKTTPASRRKTSTGANTC
jgi:hypothetical protein